MLQKSKFVHCFNSLVFQKIFDEFVEFHKPFIVQKRKTSAQFKNDELSYILCKERFGFPILGAMSKVKAEIKRNIVNKPQEINELPCSDINRDYFKLRSGTLEPITELDLHSAYLRMAVNLNYISEDTFCYVNRFQKPYRLKILGSIATKKTIERYDAKGRIIGEPEQKQDAQLAACWSNICAGVYNKMEECTKLSPLSFVLFWVDNAFFAHSNIDFAKEFFESYNYKYEIKPSSLFYSWRSQRLLDVKPYGRGTFTLSLGEKR